MTSRLRAALVLAAALSIPILVPTAAAAQTRTDSAAVLLSAARGLEAEGRADAAAALFEWIVERYADTAAAAEVRRLRETRATEGETGGRVELQVWSTLYGAWLGIAAPLIADANGPEPYGAGLLLGAPAGFFLSRLFARSRSLSEGQARAITWGGTFGTWQGVGWAEVLDLAEDRREFCSEPDGFCFEEADTDGSKLAAAAVVGGLTGIAAGTWLSRKPISRGLATTVHFGSLWGAWFGVAVGILADSQDDDLLTAALVGGDAGLIGTALLAPRWRLSRTRARLISIAGVIGGLAGVGTALLANVDDEDSAVGLAFGGSVAGLALGAALTSDRPPEQDGGGGDPDGGALLRFSPGREPRFAMPVPAPALLRVSGPTGRRALAPGLMIPVIRF